jgi:hypothetical protein
VDTEVLDFEGFWEAVGPRFCRGFWQKRVDWTWCFGGEVVVDCWWKLTS